MLFTALDFTSITSHIHNWLLFLLWLCLFILSEVISPLISSGLSGTYRSGEFIFQCPSFLPFPTVHGILKARILNWFAISFSRGPLVIAKNFFQQHKRRVYTWSSPDGQYQNHIDGILCSQRWRSTIQAAKRRLGADCGSYHDLLIAK